MKRNGSLLLLAFIIAAAPLFVIRDSEFAGADGKAEEAVQTIAPQYKPWVQAIFEPPGGEVETLLFSVQAAIGAGIIGYIIGVYKGRSSRRDEVK
ncbi:cobalt/nickel transport protein [Anoxybacillus vitaminiphilus]|uniref:Cobalt transport protein CbiN n=1 Tax=Paranoxybacillus vitaminiphilus TaxID=581036 RepID=A0A327YH92_9BACL|nr:energy-coupling factor ABC transporter substrate-binding protein [Anoxybacillus vitaminiphilus]RAK19546.1 cobalt/nickel transport protein [Anoxybacillus vitaminiphilus]